MPPFFSVIVPAYNCEHLISGTLDSVMAQSFRDFEIIVVNDGSTDATAKILAPYLQRGAILVIEQQNKGEGGARNAGIFSARGRYLAFLDQDDLWFPWTLQTYYNVLCGNDFPSILIAAGCEFSALEEVDGIGCERAEFSRYDNFFLAAKDRYLPAGTPGTIVKASEAQRVGGLSEDRVIGIDQEFYLKLGMAKGVVHITSPVTVAIRRHSGNLQKNSHMAARGITLFIEKERSQSYPGGKGWARARISIISRLARTTSMKLLQDGLVSNSWNIYCQTLGWHIFLGRFAYLSAFPFICLYKHLVAANDKARDA